MALCHISPALLCFVVIFSHPWDLRQNFRLENGHFFSFKTENYASFPLKEVYWFSFGNHWLHTALPIATGALIFFFLIFTLFSLLGSKNGGKFLNVNCFPKDSLNNLELVLVWKCISHNSRPWASPEGKKKNKRNQRNLTVRYYVMMQLQNIIAIRKNYFFLPPNLLLHFTSRNLELLGCKWMYISWFIFFFVQKCVYLGSHICIYKFRIGLMVFFLHMCLFL